MRVYILAVALLLPSVSFAISETAEGIVESGLEAYKNKGAKSALKAWVKGSGLENSKAALSQANSLLQIEDYYGPYNGHEIVKVHSISERSKIILFVVNYENGIAYGRYQSYKSKSNGWVATEFKFHTEAAIVWPNSEVFGGCKN